MKNALGVLMILLGLSFAGVGGKLLLEARHESLRPMDESDEEFRPLQVSVFLFPGLFFCAIALLPFGTGLWLVSTRRRFVDGTFSSIAHDHAEGTRGATPAP